MATAAQIEQALPILAYIVAKHGAKYAPIFEHFEAELAQMKAQEDPVERARRYLRELPNSEEELMAVIDTRTSDLDRVAALLSRPENWTRRAAARNANGEPVEPTDPTATCWCLMGALSRVTNDDPHRIERAEDELIRAAQRSGRPHLMSLAAFNDGSLTRHADIVSLLRR